ncbi:helix-hairpin-helix domain-containing protein [Sulfuricurvum sp.]|uniref:ComEA family DNA-binding protein n=1 Tax=Sulfuricurvum sp. TaxID=2025608 RepID=UPI00261679B0|nr:helix-hairpin-helix domain-containing protein [Sulfuricurvum sp.]MDD4883682.1 helix-hairpin-helix domain-containing protein [Sulfuricurvum sp.]
MVRLIFALMLFFSFAFGVVNINKANSAQLQTINGIGPTKAQEIIKYRKAHGGFKNINELVNVKGIGPKTVAKLKSQVSVR